MNMIKLIIQSRAYRDYMYVRPYNETGANRPKRYPSKNKRDGVGR